MSETTQAPAALARARRLMAALGVFWAAALGLVLAVDAPVEGGPSMLHMGAVLGVMAAGNLLVAALLRPGAKGAWGIALPLAGVSMFNCVAAPVALWAVVTLLKREVMGACLGGPWARERGE